MKRYFLILTFSFLISLSCTPSTYSADKSKSSRAIPPLTGAPTIAADDFRALTVRGFLNATKQRDLKGAFARISRRVPNKRRSFDRFTNYIQHDPALSNMSSFFISSARTHRGVGIVEARVTSRSGQTSPVTFELRQPKIAEGEEDEAWEIDIIQSGSQFP